MTADRTETRTVIICDDESHIRAVLERRFRSRGWNVITASDGRELVERAAAELPDVIVSDHQMPKLTGADAARELAGDARTRSIPIILLSGRGHIVDQDLIAQTGVRTLMPKPFSASEISDLAAGYVGKRATANAESDDSEPSVEEALDRAYETIELLYRLGDQLRILENFDEALQWSLESLLNITGFRCMAAAFDDDPSVVADLAGRVRVVAVEHDRQPSLPNDRTIRENIGSAWRALLDASTGGLIRCSDTGVTAPVAGEFIEKPIMADSRRVGAFMGFGGRQGWAAARGDATSEDVRAIDAVASAFSAGIENRRLFREQAALFSGTLAALTEALDAKDPYTRGHSQRVSLLARDLARAIGLSPFVVDRIVLAGELHDIGKIGVPDRVLLKPGRLDDAEFELIKAHPVIGHSMLSSIPALKDILPGVRNHHERWDGRGYPDGLSGSEIDITARILAVADTFDAMSSNRAYRSGRARSEVLAEIERCSGAQFDPNLVGPFISLDFSEFDELKRMHEGSSLGNQQAA